MTQRTSIDKEKDFETAVSAPVDDVSPEDDKRIRRRIDAIVLPAMFVIFCLQFLDKICMSYAAVMGFMEDNHLSTGQFTWLGSILWLGFLIGQYPQNLLMQRFPIPKVLAVNIVIWGVVLCMMAVAHNFGGLMGCRFLLGFCEACVTPGFAVMTGQWYKVREQGARTGFWLSFAGLGFIIGGSMGYGLAQANDHGKLALAGWKVLFIILGAITVAAGVAFGLVVPNSPSTAWFFSEEDRKLAVLRVRGNQQPAKSEWDWKQCREAVLDPLTWCYAGVAFFCMIPSGGTGILFTLLIKSFGFTSLQTLLLGMVNAWLTFNYAFFPWLGDKIKNRCAVAAVWPLVGIAGLAMVWAVPTHLRVVRLIGYYLITPQIVSYVTTISLITSNVAGRTKRTTVNIIYFVSVCTGNLIGPQMYRAKDAPKFTFFYTFNIACIAMTVVLIVVILLIYRRENARRDKLEAANGVVEFDPNSDFTDRTNVHFRYTY